MSSSTGSMVGILPEILVDLIGPLRGKVRRGLRESSLISQLGGSLREVRDIWGVTKEAMTGIVPVSWPECGLGADGDLPPRPPDADILAAHDAVTTKPRKAQHKLAKLVNQGRPVAFTESLDELPETAGPPGSGGPLGGSEAKAFAKARYRSLQGAGTTACLRARRTDSLRVMLASRVRGPRGAFLGDRGACCSELPLLGCSRSGHSPCTHLSQNRGAGESAPTSCPCDFPHVEAAGIRHQVESGEPCTADRKLRMDTVVRRGGFRYAPHKGYRDKSILLDVTLADRQAQVHVRGGSADHDISAASTSETRKRQHYARPGHVSFDERSKQIATLAMKSFGRLHKVHRPAGS